MADIDTEFIIYPLALRLKLLGYDEPCFARYYSNDSTLPMFIQWTTKKKGTKFNSILLPDWINNNQKISPFISVPTWQSAFSWLISQIDDEYKICLGKEGWYIYNLENEIYYGEKALERLVEIVEKKQGICTR